MSLTVRAQYLGGYVLDSVSKEPIIGATLIIKNNNKTTITNNYGFYSIHLPSDSVLSVLVFYTGYKTIDTIINIKFNQTLNFNLLPINTLQEINITANNNIDNQQTLTGNDVKKINMFLGEPDIIKAFQTLPGVKQGAEGFGALIIRGGSGDQVQYILDDMPLYYVNHMGGFISTFNSDAINKVDLYKITCQQNLAVAYRVILIYE